LTAGGKRDLGEGLKIGGLASLFYQRDSSFFDNGKDDAWWVDHAGGPMVPQTFQGTPQDGDFKTGLYDITQGKQSVQWGGLGTLGIQNEWNEVTLTFLYTKIAEDSATLAEDTRGKAYFFPGYDPNNPTGVGNDPAHLTSAPYLRLETLEYTERTTQTLQLNGHHKFPIGDAKIGDSISLKAPEIDWLVAFS